MEKDEVAEKIKNGLSVEAMSKTAGWIFLSEYIKKIISESKDFLISTPIKTSTEYIISVSNTKGHIEAYQDILDCVDNFIAEAMILDNSEKEGKN